MDPIQQAIAYANHDAHAGNAYQLHVKLTNGQTIVGTTYNDLGANGIGVEAQDGCTYVHFINPAHVAFVKLEWL